MSRDTDRKLSDTVLELNRAITDAKDLTKPEVIDVTQLEVAFRSIDDNRNAVSKACLGQFVENLGGESTTPTPTPTR